MGKTKFDTCFFERYALVSLTSLLGSRYSCLVNEDRPDLQAPDHSIGIEVTRAMEESKKVADSLLLEMAGVVDPDDDEEAEEDFKSIIDSGYAYGLRGGKYVGAVEYDYWALAMPLRRIIASKVGKVASGFYGAFSDFGLYIFCKDHLSEDEVRLAVSYTSDLQNGLDVIYSTLYLSLIDRLYVCDMKSGNISPIEISREMCRRFFRQALQSQDTTGKLSSCRQTP